MEILKLFELVTISVNFKQHCLQLQKVLYRLKQVLRVWFLTVNTFFANISFKPYNLNLNLFVRNRIYILLFVDNILIISKRLKVDYVKVTIKKK